MPRNTPSSGLKGCPRRIPLSGLRAFSLSHDYDKTGSFWFPALDHSVTDVRIFGATEMTIEYFDYTPNVHSLSPRSLV